MWKFLPLVIKNSLRNRRRSILTIASVGLSVCLLGVLMAIYYALYLGDTPPGQALRLVTRNRISLAVALPISYLQRIRQVPEVREVMAYSWFGGAYKDARDQRNFFARFACEPAKLFTNYPEFRISEPEKRAFETERTAAVMYRPLAERLGLRLGDRITLKGDIYPVTLDLTLRGLYDSDESGDTLWFNNEYLRESLKGPRRDQVGMFNILATSPDAVPRVAKAVDDLFRNSTAQTRTESERAFALGFISQMGNVKVILLSICAAVTFTIVLVSANTMAMSVRERVREVGVLKTLGFTNGHVLSIILGEAMLISLIGGAVGHILALVLCAGVRGFARFMPQLRSLGLQPELALVLLTVAVSIGLLSALIPALSASRTPILNALRFAD